MTSKLSAVRRARLRLMTEERGGLTRLSKQLGYANPSFLSQMIGPDPTREITEKTARKIEETLGLPAGELDRTPQSGAAEMARAADPTVSLVADVIRIVGSECEKEGVAPTPLKFSEIVALAYADSAEHGGAPRPEHVKQLVRLLR